MPAERDDSAGVISEDRTPHTRSVEAHHSDERDRHDATEATPLLGPNQTNGDIEAADGCRQQSAASLLRSFQGKSRGGRRWPSLIALLLLCIVAVLIMVLGFFAPATMEEYAMQAATFEPTSLTVDSFTATGVRARVQGQFSMDSSRVEKKSVRDFGRFGTWIAREAESGESEVEVSLPEYGNLVLGTATVPRVKVNLRDGHKTAIDFVSEVTPGDFNGLKRIARDWIDGRLGTLHILGKANVPVKSGIFSIGTQTLSQTILFDRKGGNGKNHQELPALPAYKIRSMTFHDAHMPEGKKGVAADISIKVRNEYPFNINVPALDFAVFVDACSSKEPRLQLADASVGQITVQPKEDVYVNVTGLVRNLSRNFTQACPGTSESPLDRLLGRYMDGKNTTVYVRGSEAPSHGAPQWISDILASVTVPVNAPGHAVGHLIKSFALNDTHFSLPDPFAEPNTPEANPSVSAKVEALIVLPENMNVNLNVSRVKANADVYYHGSKLGNLVLDKWQSANSARYPSKGSDGPSMLVESLIKNAPLEITDDDVFTDFIQAMLFGGKKVVLDLKAKVDVEVQTTLGELVIRKIPASGSIPVKPVGGSGSGLGSLRPKIGSLEIVDSTRDSLTINALANFSNPTEYAATVPFADIHILVNGSLLGHATARNISVGPGKNTNIPVTAVWEPLKLGGAAARQVGIELLSQYLSGYNTTITLQAHEGSVPSQPALGRALSKFTFELPTPRLGTPRPRDPPDDGLPTDPNDPDNDDQGPHSISDAIMHLFTSSATFNLHSPLKTTTVYVTHINATAYYKGDDVGHIDYDETFAVPPAKEVTTPRLPVAWSLGSVGYEAIRNAVGGSLKLSARATVGVRLGKWEERIWFQGKGIGAKIRL